MHAIHRPKFVIKIGKHFFLELPIHKQSTRRGVYRVLVGKPEGKRPLVRPRHRWEDNIKMDLQEVRCWEYGVD